MTASATSANNKRRGRVISFQNDISIRTLLLLLLLFIVGYRRSRLRRAILAVCVDSSSTKTNREEKKKSKKCCGFNQIPLIHRRHDDAELRRHGAAPRQQFRPIDEVVIVLAALPPAVTHTTATATAAGASLRHCLYSRSHALQRHRKRDRMINETRGMELDAGISILLLISRDDIL